MIVYLVKMLAVSFLMTECIELAMAACFGMRKGKQLLLVFLVNSFTNPPVVMLAFTARESGIVSGSIQKAFIYILIEMLVVGIEGFIYHYCMKENNRPILFSLCLNGVSFIVGCLM